MVPNRNSAVNIAERLIGGSFLPRGYAFAMPIEFDNKSRPQRTDKPKVETGPAISFSQDKALSNSGKTSTISWVLILLVILPVAGILIGLFQIQEARQSASRGKPWSTSHVQGLYAATMFSVLLTVGFGLLLI